MTEYKKEILKKLMVQEELTRGTMAHWGIAKALEIVEQTPNAPEWIPVTERLPENSRPYKVTVETKFDDSERLSREIIIARYAREYSPGWEDDTERKWVEYFDPSDAIEFEDNNAYVKVIAWGPLPEPYKGEKDG